MKWFNNMKIGAKLISVMLIVSLIPLVAVGVFAYFQADEALRAAALRTQNVFAEQKAQLLEAWFHELAAQVNVAAATRSTYNSLNILRQLNGDTTAPEWLERFEAMNDGFSTLANELGLAILFVTDLGGKIVYGNDPSLLGADLSQRDYVQEAMRGQPSNSEYFYSGVVNQNIVAVAAPILSQGTSGEIVGVFGIAISESDISDRIVAGMAGMGSSADAYLVDSTGMLLSKPLFGNPGNILGCRKARLANERIHILLGHLFILVSNNPFLLCLLYNTLSV